MNPNELSSEKSSKSPDFSFYNESSPVGLEQVFGSRGRVRILKLLATKGELNISKIAELSRLNHLSTRKHLDLFLKANIVEKKVFGRVKIFRFCIENLKARAIKRLFERWNG
jgi:DNA-binding transcriptional ArsR family regulator